MKAGVDNTWTWLAMLLVVSMSASSYSEEESIPRDPFWPVGYEKPKPPDLEEEGQLENDNVTRPDQMWPDLPVQGTSRGMGGQYFALVKNVGVVSAGEDVSLQKDGLWYHWRIAEIGPNGIRAMKLGVTRQRDILPRIATPAGNGQKVQE